MPLRRRPKPPPGKGRASRTGLLDSTGDSPYDESVIIKFRFPPWPVTGRSLLSPQRHKSIWPLSICSLTFLVLLLASQAAKPQVSPLFKIVESRNLSQLAKVLPEHAAEVNQTYLGRSPLHLAVINYRLAMVELLLAAGADPNAPDAYGNTPLHLAVFCRRPKLIGDLVAAGAEVSARNHFGSTPLHVAAYLGHSAEVTQNLLRLGADPTARDDQGQTPLEIAARRAPGLRELMLAARGPSGGKGKVSP